MNELKIINNPMFGEIRLFPEPDKPLFCGVDVARPLGYKNIPDALARHCKGIVKRDTLTNGGVQKVIFITEGDVYRLIAHSKLPAAEQFERWIFDEVLPSIRKHGAYMTPQTLDRIISDPDFGIRLLTELKSEREQKAALQAENAALTETNAALTAQIEADAPRVMWAKAAEGSKDGMLIREFCKFLRQSGVEIGEKRMFADLRKRGWLIKCGRDMNKPTQRAMDMGLFTVKETAIVKPNGDTKTATTPMLTEKGKQYFNALYVKEASVNAAATV